MDYYIIGIVALCVFYAAMILWEKYRYAGTSGNNVALSRTDDCIMLVVEPCRKIIGTALDCMAEGNVTEVCKNHRTAGAILYSLDKRLKEFSHSADSKDVFKLVYVNYMLECADKISETARHMVTHPTYGISIADKCEIQSVRKYIDAMLKNVGTPADFSVVVVTAVDNKTFLEYIISERSKSMTYADFDDSSVAYSYLRLLYYLHSFVNSFHRTISTS